MNGVPTQPFSPVGVTVYLIVMGLVPKLVTVSFKTPFAATEAKGATVGSGLSNGKLGILATA